eukprot:CAMPEP_0184499476 /NCGR_PEP_ID=MMETSP0113_2-20130426/41600_1 /TAXON_ID=91329 /ORGANISM="Norrisiella sphaerica, Strain BC52" /LENGTH=108 /DNA_ID=CAMNT_0026887393 /DNA_START=153 /DNA_END=479 /DNA_ORIENTATION=+
MAYDFPGSTSCVSSADDAQLLRKILHETRKVLVLLVLTAPWDGDSSSNLVVTGCELVHKGHACSESTRNNEKTYRHTSIMVDKNESYFRDFFHNLAAYDMCTVLLGLF